MVRAEEFGPTRPNGIGAVTEQRREPCNGARADEFRRELTAASEALKISGHASRRLMSEGKPLEGERISRLQEAVQLAASKHSRDCLVLLDDTAFVVNVESRTVITAVSKERRQHGIFTNIDTVVVC